MKTLVLFACTGLMAVAQDKQPSGAKALFFSPENGQETMLSSGSNGATQHSSAAPHSRNVAKPVITGLKYYVELRQADGQVLRISTNRVFHSGERIRLHVFSNVNGDLVIYQKQEDQPEERLFPGAGSSGASGHVERNTDVVVPSTHAWFRFDEHPGEILLTLMVKARGSQTNAGSEAAENGDIATAELAHEVAGKTKGSKALRIEEDSSGDNAEYKVLDSRLDSKIPAGVIATEVMLSHAK